MNTTVRPAAECQAIDTEIAAAMVAADKAAARLADTIDTVQWTIGNKADRRGRRPEALTADEALARLAEMETAGRKTYGVRHADMVLKVAAARETAATTAAEYDRQEARYEGWSRFFLVTSSDGHIHSSMRCHTCHATTGYGWLPQLSGLDMAAAVEDQGSLLCSVCFPDAPVEYTDGSRLGREALAARAERDAKAAAKAEKVAKNTLVATVEYVRFGRRERVTKVTEAKQLATDLAGDLVDGYLAANRPDLVAEAASALPAVCAAIAAKIGTTATAEQAAAAKRAARR